MALPTKADILKAAEEWPALIAEHLKPVVHYGFIPFILVLGMATTKPRPTLLQLFSPA